MDLFLWRHADAEDLVAQRDLERRLTPRGERQAAQMAAWLNERLPGATRIVASPARRCQQTVGALGRSFETLPAIAPGASPESVLAAAGWPHAGGTVLAVGHQPTLGFVVSLLAGDAASRRGLPKAGVAWLRRRDDGGVELVEERSPDEP